MADADSNGVTHKYIYGKGLLAVATSSARYCYHFNGTGSTVALYRLSQDVVNSYAYEPFGAILSQQETISQPFKFVGQYGVMAEPNGLYYMRARYYDPSVGRFISEDPLGFGGGDVNLFAYVHSNPINGNDPSGLRPLTPGELAMLQTVYNNQIDYGKIDLRSGANPLDPRTYPPVLTGHAVTLENTIYFPSSAYSGDFSQSGIAMQYLLVHETGHVWEYQTNSAYSWAKAAADRKYNYNLDPCKKLTDYGWEQQPSILADYFYVINGYQPAFGQGADRLLYEQTASVPWRAVFPGPTSRP